MQVSDTTNLTGLFEDIDFLCETDSTSYPIKDKARNINRWIWKAVVRRIKANKRWKFDDANHTTHPIVTTTLVDGQQDYSLPTDLLKLSRVEIKDNNGDYYILKNIDETEITTGLTEFYETNGRPAYYDIVGDSVFLYPAPSATDVTTAQGLKVVYTRDFDAILSTDTTQEPCIAEPFHRIGSLGASYDYMLKRDVKRAQAYRAEVEGLLEELTEFEADKNESVKTHMQLSHNVRNYL